MPTSIIIKGYYGFGNLGDDILMLCAYGWLRENFPQSKIKICTDGNQASYIPKLISPSIEIIQNHKNVKADWIVYGGGGVFFDFKDGGFKYKVLNTFIMLLGLRRFQKIYKKYRSLRGTRGAQANLRAGLGLGVGTYTPSSKRLYADISELLDFKFLLVRDEESVMHANKLNVKCPILVSSDLAFMDRYWKPDDFPKNQGRKIGFVLRDWIYDNNSYFSIIKEVADHLILNEIEVQFFSFDRFSDKAYLLHFSSYGILSWDPHHQTAKSFLEKLNACSLVVTSRAHGAILPACLNIPAICLEIEPKLKHVAKLLKHSALLVSKPFDKDKLIDIILSRIQVLDLLKDATEFDKEINAKQMAVGLSAFKQFTEQQDF
jgi:polysaccharide pyruvyl transferase WcaK-like protein